MQDFPETRESLLVRVQQNDRDAWDQFSNIYRPVIYRMARRRGRQHADAEDIAQKVLVKVAAAIAGFRPNDGRAKFRTWLTTVCRNTLTDELRRTRPEMAVGGLATADGWALAELDAGVSEQELSLENRRQVFRWAAAQAAGAFAQSTWRAFWLTAVEGAGVRQAANQLEISVGAVYTARSRVMQYLKEKVREYDDAQL